MNARGIPSIQYTQLNQLEGLRRMQHARGMSKVEAVEALLRTHAPATLNVDTVIGRGPRRPPGSHQVTVFHADPPSLMDTVQARIAADPCSVLGHRPAWLVGGGMACGICGAHL